MIEKFLPLFQLCDTNFPNGGFTQSFGFETYIAEGEIHDRESFSEWVDIFLKDQLVTSDGLGLRMAYEALEKEDLDRLWEIDRLLAVQNLARETREGTGFMGKSLLRTSEAIYDDPVVKAYHQRIKEKQAFGHPAMVFAIVGHHLSIEKKAVISFYLYNTVVNFVQNAVRAIPLGQTDGQRIIAAFHPKIQRATERILSLDEIEFGTIAPGVEVAQMKHERITARMFMS